MVYKPLRIFSGVSLCGQPLGYMYEIREGVLPTCVYVKQTLVPASPLFFSLLRRDREEPEKCERNRDKILSRLFATCGGSI